MSYLCYLKLDGIRSYAYVPPVKASEVTAQQKAAALDEQTIKFQQPLTLIWGHNGSGKTTIIEALRVSATGQMPPNSDKGKNFLTDSTLLRQSHTSGCLELCFRALNEKELIVRRHLKVTHTAQGASKFSTERSTIQQVEDGKCVSIMSQQCIDLDRQIPFLMGVSIPIINNVIFCHQEEQLWMFSDNLTLKGIFDELFDTTKFAKIQDQLRDQIKKNMTELKKQHDTFEYAKRDMVDAGKQKQIYLQEIADLLKEAYRISQDAQELKKLESELQGQDLDKMKEDLVQKQQLVSVLQFQMQNDVVTVLALKKDKKYQDYDNMNQKQLEGQLAQLSAQQQGEISKQKSLKQQQLQIELNLDKKNKELADYDNISTSDQLKQELKIYKDQLSNTFQIKQNISDDNFGKFIREKLVQLNEEAEKNQEQSNKQLEKLNQQVLQVQARINAIDVKQQISNEEYNKAQTDIKSLEIEIQAQTKILQQNQNKKPIEMHVEQILEVEKANLKQIQQDIQTNQLLISKYYEEAARVQAYDQVQDYRNQFKVLDEKCQQEQEQRDTILRQNGWFSQLKFQGDVKDNLKELELFKERIIVQDLKDKARETARKTEITKIKTQIEITKKNKDQLMNDLESLQKIIGNVTDIKYDEKIKQVKQNLKDAKNQYIKYEYSSIQFIEQYIQQCKTSKKCVMCSSALDAQTFEKVMGKLITNQPTIKEKLKIKEELIAQIQKEKQVLVQNRDKYIKYQDISKAVKEKDDQIAQLELQLQSQNVPEEANIIDQTQIRQRDLMRLQDLLQSKSVGDKNDVALKIKLIEQKYPNLYKLEKAGSQDVRVLNMKKMDLQNQLQLKQQDVANYESQVAEAKKQEQQQKEIELIRGELTKNNIRIKQLKSIVREDYSQEKIQEEYQMKSIKEEIKNINEQFQKDKNIIDKQKSAIEQVQPQVERIIQKLNDIKKKNSTNIKDGLTKLQTEINKLEKELQNVKEQIVIVESMIVDYLERMKTVEIQMKINEIGQKNLDKRLNDALVIIENLKEVIEQANQRKQDIALYQQRIGFGKDKLIEKYVKSQTNKSEIQRRFKNSEFKYMESLADKRILQNLNDDLQKSLKSIEDSMIEFHRQKMFEINKYLAETWQKIYHGKDIKYIQIKSDEEPSEKGKKKNYNYRLVMRQNDCDIDMRGRCSMGQKMLASIVFRLALSESFGNNCGVLALDEPTSNLDKQHIEALSESLSALIELMNEYKQQFQLIIITHDLDLVKMLSRYSDTYAKISKKPNGFSCIQMKSLDELK